MPRLATGQVACTLTANPNLGSGTITIRSVSLSGLPTGWTMSTTPSGTISGDGTVIAPAQALAAGASWSFTATIGASCTATPSTNLAISTTLARSNGTVTGPDAAGPSTTYAVQAAAAAGTVSTSVVSSSVNWSVPYSFVDQTVSGSVTYGVTGSVCSGWAVSVSTVSFNYTGAANGVSIPANRLNLTSVGGPVLVSGGNDGVSSVPTSGELSAPRTVLRAQTGSGIGTYRQDLQVALTVPGGSAVGSYQSVIIITTSAAP